MQSALVGYSLNYSLDLVIWNTFSPHLASLVWYCIHVSPASQPSGKLASKFRMSSVTCNSRLFISSVVVASSSGANDCWLAVEILKTSVLLPMFGFLVRWWQIPFPLDRWETDWAVLESGSVVDCRSRTGLTGWFVDLMGSLGLS